LRNNRSAAGHLTFGRFDEVRFRSFNLVYGVAQMQVTW
jgi:hypothetical protein